MATSLPLIDDLIRDYFQYRNLTSTSRLFDNEISKLPLGQYRADLILEQLTLYIHQFDINNLIEYWTQVEQRLLSALTIDSQQLINIFTKIRINLYRCYLIHAVQSSKTDKINEFFERLTKVLQQSSEWTKEWFALPYIKNPEEHLTFQVYFSKRWNELFWISLQNFLSTAFYHITPPQICSMEEDIFQKFDNLMSPKSSSTMTPFAEVIDDTQVPNLTIISKLRSRFLPNIKENSSTVSDTSFSTNHGKNLQ